VRGRSGPTNLLETLEEWTSALDEGYGIDAIYLDYQKAFDTVPHKRLVVKLQDWYRWTTVELVNKFSNS